MFYNDKKTIGVIAEKTESELQNTLCDGIIQEARERDYNVAVFSSHGTSGQISAYAEGDIQFYDLPPYEELSGLVLVLDTMDNPKSRDFLVKIVKERCSCPVVSMRLEYPGFSSVLVDNASCMEGLIRHFIEFHGFKKLCFMTGPADHKDALQRLDCFKRVMAEYDLPVGEHQIFYGDFWKFQGPKACDWFLNEQERPEAILCANDYMAGAVASELIARGYRIPEDICVCGYDGLDSMITFSPSMTTARAPFHEMGRQAVVLIDDLQGKKKIRPRKVYLHSELLLRESCGCMKRNDNHLLQLSRSLYEQLREDNNTTLIFTFMSTHLASATTVEELSVMVPEYLPRFPHLHSFAICLNQNMAQDNKLHQYTDTMEVRVAMKNQLALPGVNIAFDRSELLPIEMVDDTTQVWFFTPLHFLDYCLGYEAFRFDEEQPAGHMNFQFDVVMYNKIYDTLVHAKMEKIIAALEQTSLQDALTGLYNRGGFTLFGNQLFDANRLKGAPVFVAVADMDNLKRINDGHGHAAGDFAIKKVANTLRECCKDHFIFGRTGGDEFYVIGQDMEEAEAQSYMDLIEEKLILFNKERTKPFDLHISYGHYWDTPRDKDTLDDFIKVADHFMYHNKLENKRRRAEASR